MAFDAPTSVLHRRISTSDLTIFGLLCLAAVWRLVFFLEMYASPYARDLGLDGEVFHRAALEAAAGHLSGGDVFFQAPLYSWFLGLVYFVFGPAPVVAKLAQIVLSVASCWLVYRIADRVFDRTTGLVALAIASVYGPFLFFANELVVVTLFVFLMLSAIVLIMEASIRGGLGWWAAAGLAFGIAGITRGTILPIAAAVPLWLVLSRWRTGAFGRAVLEASVFSIGVILMIVPVTLHNYLADGSLVLVASNDGVNFFIGNNPDSDGMTAAVVGTRGDHLGGKEDQIRIAREALGDPEASAGSVSKWWYGQGLRFMREQPGSALRLLMRKAAIFCNAYEVGNNRVIGFMARYSRVFRWAAVGFWVVFPLAVAGLLIGRGRRPWIQLLYIWAVLYSVVLIAFFVTARYRLPVLPVLIIFAAAAVVEWGRWIKARGWSGDRRRSALVVGSVAAAVLAAIVARPVPSIRNSDAQAFFNEAEAFRSSRDYAAAAKWYGEALTEHPGYCDAGFNLARIQAEIFMDPNAVVGTLGPMVGACSDDLEIRRLLGLALCAVDRCDEGIVYLGEVAERLPQSEVAMEDLERARRYLEKMSGEQAPLN